MGRIGTGFEVSCWRLAVTLSWLISWFITMKGVELIHRSYKTYWEEFMAADDAGIILVSNYFAEFSNTLLYHAKSCNNWMDIFCIIVDGR